MIQSVIGELTSFFDEEMIKLILSGWLAECKRIRIAENRDDVYVKFPCFEATTKSDHKIYICVVTEFDGSKGKILMFYLSEPDTKETIIEFAYDCVRHYGVLTGI